MQDESEIKNISSPEDAMAEIMQDNIEYSNQNLSCDDAIAQMESENAKAEEQGQVNNIPSKKQENQILKVIQKTELLMGDFFRRLDAVDKSFDNVAQIFFNNAANIAASIKNPNEESKKIVMANLAAGVAIKGVGALWQAIQTNQQLNGIIQIFAREAEQKMPYVGMLIDWLDITGDIAFARLLDSANLESAITNLELYRGIDYTFRLACYLYSVYDSALSGEFTKMAYPSLYDVNRSLINILAHIENKETNEEQLTANRSSLSTVANRIRSVMSGEKDLPEFIDVLLASDDQLMATAVNMGLPSPDFFVEEDVFEKSPHFPFEDLEMLPESVDFIADFYNLKSAGNSHAIAEEVAANKSLDLVDGYMVEFKDNQNKFKSREILYGINVWLFTGIIFMLFWEVWDWKWYWSLLMSGIMFIIGGKIAPTTNLYQTCRDKAILLEREFISTTRASGGYTEVIDFRQLQRKNNNVFICAIIFGILGCFAGPFGFILGVAIGSIIGLLVKSYKPEEEDWRNLSIGSGLLAKIICGLLSVCLLYLIIFACFG